MSTITNAAPELPRGREDPAAAAVPAGDLERAPHQRAPGAAGAGQVLEGGVHRQELAGGHRRDQGEGKGALGQGGGGPGGGVGVVTAVVGSGGGVVFGRATDLFGPFQSLRPFGEREGRSENSRKGSMCVGSPLPP